ncbi:HAD-IC family P-type ATPase [Caloramator sp. mosi_1]|nr:HAD-IC family P-type ATPase [Caloramator sp. mosi_1]WDC85667.1 HAD-IC family P-type ATPase [Caloramator sp. mosi_1]
MPSKGVFAEYNGQKVLIGNDEIMRDYNIDISLYLDKYEILKNNFYTPIFVAINGKLSAIIILKDVLRNDSYNTIQTFKGYGINNITLLTGDKHENAIHIGEQLGINRIYSECSLQEKSDIVRKISRRNTVLMMGDGINDVMAMREVDVSVCLTNTACDRVFMHSDCIILDDNLMRVCEFVSLSKKSYNAIQNTITFSRLYNLILGGFAFFGYFDAFTAKSLNTLNSLYVLLLNKRIEYFIPDRLHIQKDISSNQGYYLQNQFTIGRG